jgi:hypothetical protein
MALKPLTSAITTPPTPPRCSLSPYKRAKSTPGPHRPFFSSLPSSLVPSFALMMSSSYRHSSRPSHHPFAVAHDQVSTPLALPPTSIGWPQCCALARRHRALMSVPPTSIGWPQCLCVGKAPPCPHVRAARSTRYGPGPQDFPLKNKSENQLSREICIEAPRFLCNQAAVHKNSEKTPNFQNISKNTPSNFPEITKRFPQLLFAISSQL